MNRWTFGGGVAVAITGLTAYAITQISTLKSQTIPTSHEQFYGRMLEKARKLQQQDQPDQAIAQVVGIPTNSKHFSAAEALQENLSNQLLDLAHLQHRRGNLTKAIALLKAIPMSVSTTENIQVLKATWTDEAKHLQALQTAAANQDWAQAMYHIEQLRGSNTFNSPTVQFALQRSITASPPIIAAVQPVQSSPSSIAIPKIPTTNSTVPPLPPVAVDPQTILASTEQSLENTVRSPSSIQPVSDAPTRQSQKIVTTPNNSQMNAIATVQLPQLEASTRVQNRPQLSKSNVNSRSPSVALTTKRSPFIPPRNAIVPESSRQRTTKTASTPATSDPISATSIAEMIESRNTALLISKPSVAFLSESSPR